MLGSISEAIASVDPYFTNPSVIWGLVTYTVWLWCWGGRYQLWKDKDRILGPLKLLGRPLGNTKLQLKKVRRAIRVRNRKFIKSEIGYFQLVWAPLSLALSTILILGMWNDPPVDLVSGLASRRAWFVGFVGIQILGDVMLSKI